jgi:hypothetical protein
MLPSGRADRDGDEGDEARRQPVAQDQQQRVRELHAAKGLRHDALLAKSQRTLLRCVRSRPPRIGVVTGYCD